MALSFEDNALADKNCRDGVKALLADLRSGKTSFATLPELLDHIYSEGEDNGAYNVQMDC